MTKCVFVVALLLDLVLSRHSQTSTASITVPPDQDSANLIEDDNPDQNRVHWRYAAEQEWPGKMCKHGKRQSPIDISTAAVKPDFTNQFIKHGPLKFKGYNDVLASGVNNGHTLQFSTEGHPGMHPTLSGGPLAEPYRLEQLHFHWQSEHAVNGKKYPMELHFVHVRAGLDVDNALELPDGLVIVAVFCNVLPLFGDSSTAVDDELMPHVPNLLTPGSTISGAIINMATLLSPNRKDYYAYLGSLTSPECNEAVIWIIFQKPIYITDELYELFGKSGVGSNNFRSLQPLGTQTVYSVPHREVTTPAIVVFFSQFANYVKEFFVNITTFLSKGLKKEEDK